MEILRAVFKFVFSLMLFPPAYFFVNKKVVRKNFRIAFPEKEPFFYDILLARGIWHFANVLFDAIFGLPDKTLSALINDARPYGLGVDKSGIIATAHIGSWEAANLSGAAVFSGKYGVIVNEIKNPLFSLVYRKRASLGAKVFLAGSIKDMKALSKEVKAGLSVAVVFDHAGRDGIMARFFTRPAPIPKGILWLSKSARRDIVPCLCVYDKGRYRLKVFEPIAWNTRQEEIARRLNAILEQEVRAYPWQYLWTYKRWKFSRQRDVLILSDGKAGHEKQSVALLSYLREAYPNEEIKASIIKAQIKKNPLLKLIGFMPLQAGCSLLKKSGLGHLLENNADLIISTGSSLIGINVFLKRFNIAKNAVIMSSGLYSGLIDIKISMRHDSERIKNGFVIDGALSFFDENKAQEAASSLGISRDDYIAVLIGGNARGYELTGNDVEALLEVAQEYRNRVLITTSRRTSPDIEGKVGQGAYRYAVIANKENPPGVIEAFFYVADKAIITPDSISMVSEALNAGLSVGIWAPIMPKRKKFIDFLNGLYKQGLIKFLRTKQDIRGFIEAKTTKRGPNAKPGLIQYLRSKKAF